MFNRKGVAGVLVAAAGLLVFAGCGGTTADATGGSTAAHHKASAEPTFSETIKGSSTTVTHKPAAPKKKAAPKYTTSETMAIAAAKQYLSVQAFSKKGLVEQLSSSSGDGYPKADAEFAVNHITVDWNEQAVKAAKAYLKLMPMSEADLVQQLHSSAGDQFTLAQAKYGAKKAYGK